MFFQCFEFMITFLESYLAIMLVLSVLIDQREDIRKNIIIAFVVTVVVIGLNQIQLLSVSTTIAAVLSLAMCAKLFYPVRLLDAILAATFFSVLTYMVDFFNMAVLGTLFSDDKFGYHVTAGFSWYRIIYICACKVVLSYVCILLSKKVLRYVGIRIRKVWAATVIAVAVVGYFGMNTIKDPSSDLVWTWLFMILVFMLAIYAVMQYIFYVEDKKRLSLALERNQIQIETYNRVIQSYQANQTFLHDLKNQYLILENYLKEKQYEEAERYISELQQLEYENQHKKFTGILPIDILLSYKVDEAKEKQIEITIDTEEVQLAIPEQDMVSLLGNVLDYAMESLKNTNNVFKSIHMEIKQKSNMLCIQVESPCSGEMKRQHTSIFSEKKSDVGRMELDGIKMLVSKYSGSIENSYLDHMWRMMIVMSHSN